MEKSIHFKYLIVNDQDLLWGITVDTVGHQQILPNSIYPQDNHPTKFTFSSKKGRVLDEYQLQYIRSGEGGFISGNSIKQQTVKEGNMFLLFPNEWHSYKQDEHIGWDAYWIGFTGVNIDNLIEHGFFNKQNPILSVGINYKIVELYEQAIKTAIEQKAGFQEILAGIVEHLLGLAYSLDKNNQSEDLKVINQINEAKIIINENLSNGIRAEEIAKRINISYSWFRQIFKEYTGLAPAQYIKELKIQKVKELLTNSTLSVKEITFIMGFHKPDYFYTIFKSKTGMTPIQFREFTQKSKSQ